MYLTISLNRFYDCVVFDSLVAAITFAKAKEQYAKTPIDVMYVGPRRRLRVVRVGKHV